MLLEGIIRNKRRSRGVMLSPACVLNSALWKVRDVFPTEKHLNGLPLAKLWLFLSCRGLLGGKRSAIQEETFRDVAPPLFLQKLE